MQIKPNKLVSLDALAVATINDLEDLIRSCSQILRFRREDSAMFDYVETVQVEMPSANVDYLPDFIVIELDKHGNVTERPVELTDHSSRKYYQRMKHSWTAQYAAKSGSVEVFNNNFYDAHLLINGRRIDMSNMFFTPDMLKNEGADYSNNNERESRIKRFVSGVRSEFLKEAKKWLTELQDRSPEDKLPGRRRLRLDMEAYVEWVELSGEIAERENASN